MNTNTPSHTPGEQVERLDLQTLSDGDKFTLHTQNSKYSFEVQKEGTIYGLKFLGKTDNDNQKMDSSIPEEGSFIFHNVASVGVRTVIVYHRGPNPRTADLSPTKKITLQKAQADDTGSGNITTIVKARNKDLEE